MAFPKLPDNPYQYQNLFNYSVWTAGTTARFVNVPWDYSYRDIVRFDNAAARDTWFNSLNSATIDINKMTVLKYGQPVYINIPFNTANAFNYVVVNNPLAPVPHESATARHVYYYFVLDMEYIAPNTTKVNLMLDVWMTYGLDLTFGNCYVERGHAAAASASVTGSDMRKYCAVPEGLDVGAEYVVSNKAFQNFGGTGFYILVSCTADLTSGDFGSVSNPKLNTSKGGTVARIPSGTCNVLFSWGWFNKFVENLADKPWISQCVQSITAIPIAFINQIDFTDTILDAKCLILSNSDNEVITQKEYDLDYWVFNTQVFVNDMKRYQPLIKLQCFPYTVIEAENYSSSPVIIKPELISPTANSKISCVSYLSIAQPSPKIALTFKGYNSYSSTDKDIEIQSQYEIGVGTAKQFTTTIKGGEQLDFALIWSTFAQFQICNNQYINYLASNANQINWSFQSADWSQQKALRSASTAFDNANIGLDYNTASTGLQTQNSAAVQALNSANAMNNLNINTVGNGIGTGISTVGNIASENYGGAAASLANGATGMVTNYMTTTNNIATANTATSMNNGLATQLTQAGNSAQMQQAGNNYSLARYAAKGDYQNTIAGIQAKLQDAKMLQPSVSGTLAGDAFNFANGIFGVMFSWKTLQPSVMASIGEYFFRYGYAIERSFTPPADLKCAANFTYWKMKAAYIFGDIPELYKNTVRGIFEKGVTVWSDPDKIGKIDVADNDLIKKEFY